jgi:hypothetical protein
MTWRKTGIEFDDQCADVDLSDHAYRTHMEAIGYIYKTRADDCLVNKGALRRFATSDKAREGIKELIDHGFWRDRSTHYEVVHHADVIAESLAAQAAKKERDRNAQKAARERKAKAESAPEVSADVSADTRQTDRQTDKQLESRSEENCQHGIPMGDKPDSWFSEGMACADCARERKGA